MRKFKLFNPTHFENGVQPTEDKLVPHTCISEGLFIVFLHGKLLLDLKQPLFHITVLPSTHIETKNHQQRQGKRSN
ncbi:hypothetical protein VIGAN_02085600 [Vigna angularis var. angularis]|uniref:Uncharacterized protein n=1 Tax=Vigna angularis var. angularis TaxID=157739 RepID=A0A0S3RCU2_PHAAN|nr:hypothetical protein VIGAN_02085600 [Vigna angularis var. angularis]